MEIFYMLVGLYYFYAVIHAIVLQWKDYKSRTSYEKVVTWIFFGFTVLLIISSATE